MQVVSKFTYTLESIIQAGKMLVAVDHVPIRTNAKTRESRLFPSMWAYVRRNTRVDLPRSTRCTSRCACSWPPRRSSRSSAAVIWARFLYFFFFSDEGPGSTSSR